MPWSPWITPGWNSFGPFYPVRERVIKGHCGSRVDQATLVADLYAENFDTVTNEGVPDTSTTPSSRWGWRAQDAAEGQRVAWVGEYDDTFWRNRFLTEDFFDDVPFSVRYRSTHFASVQWLSPVRVGTVEMTVQSHGDPDPDEYPVVSARLVPYDSSVESWLDGSSTAFPSLTVGSALSLDIPDSVLFGSLADHGKMYLVMQVVPPATPPAHTIGAWFGIVGNTGPQMALKIQGPDYQVFTTDVPPALRRTQRNDGAGAAAHPRLRSSTSAPSSRQRSAAPRLGTNGRYR